MSKEGVPFSLVFFFHYFEEFRFIIIFLGKYVSFAVFLLW